MSYIPKYILKRMLTKDCLKLEGDMIVIEVINVISPISIDEIPEDVLNYLEVKVDGNVLPDLSGLRLSAQGKEFSLSNIKEAVGLTLPVGEKLIIKMPNTPGVKKGETHTVDVTIKANNPISITAEREVC